MSAWTHVPAQGKDQNRFYVWGLQTHVVLVNTSVLLQRFMKTLILEKKIILAYSEERYSLTLAVSNVFFVWCKLLTTHHKMKNNKRLK